MSPFASTPSSVPKTPVMKQPGAPRLAGRSFTPPLPKPTRPHSATLEAHRRRNPSARGNPGRSDPPDFVVFAFTVSLQDEDRDLPCGQRLQFDVVRVSLGSPLPPFFSLGPMNLAGCQLENFVAVLHRDLRVGPEVVDPGGVLRAPAE